MKVGCTATRKGLTVGQAAAARDILERLYESNTPQEFHHGNCVGGDEQLLSIAKATGYKIIAHPAEGLETYQLDLSLSDEIREHRPPLERNRDIVDEVRFLIACPYEPKEPQPARGQGTWSTVRYARNLVLFAIIWPDGTFREENIVS